MQDLLFEISKNGLIILQYASFVNKFLQNNNFLNHFVAFFSRITLRIIVNKKSKKGKQTVYWIDLNMQ